MFLKTNLPYSLCDPSRSFGIACATDRHDFDRFVGSSFGTSKTSFRDVGDRRSAITLLKTYEPTKRALIQTRRGEIDYGEHDSRGFVKSTFLTRLPLVDELSTHRRVLLLPVAVAYCYYLLLVVIAFCCCLLLLPTAVACCVCLLLSPLA